MITLKFLLIENNYFQHQRLVENLRLYVKGTVSTYIEFYFSDF
jgi:hypothetical protein